MPLGHVVTLAAQVDEATALGFGQRQEESWVLFLVHQRVLGGVVAQSMAIHAQWPMMVVEHNVKECLTVVGPF